MLKFFRRRRRKLLDEAEQSEVLPEHNQDKALTESPPDDAVATGARRVRRLKKYLAYATGEILLAVIGILIALQINAWNQAYQDRIIERNYLINLLEDMKADTAWLNFYIINRYDGKVAALNKVRNYYQGTYEITDTLAFWVEAGYGAVFANTPPYGISRDVYDEPAISSVGCTR